MTECKHLYETNYCQWVCEENGTFTNLGQEYKKQPFQCENCERYEVGIKSDEIKNKFKEYDEQDTIKIELYNCIFRLLDTTCTDF